MFWKEPTICWKENMSCLADRLSKCTEIKPLNLDMWRLLVIPMNRFLGKTKGKLDGYFEYSEEARKWSSRAGRIRRL